MNCINCSKCNRVIKEIGNDGFPCSNNEENNVQYCIWCFRLEKNNVLSLNCNCCNTRISLFLCDNLKKYLLERDEYLINNLNKIKI